MFRVGVSLVLILAAACGGSGGGGGSEPPGDALPLPPPSCEAAGGSATVATPTMTRAIADVGNEAWLASPGLADLDGDGTMEIVIARSGRVSVWHADGTEVWSAEVDGRAWASPVIDDLTSTRPGKEVAVTARGTFYMWDATGAPVDGFPVDWEDELRSLAAGDLDGNGRLELAAVSTNGVQGGGLRDIVFAIHGEDGSTVDGFPPNTTGAGGCDETCHVYVGYDQNIAIGDLEGDGADEIFATQDNAYLSLHDGTGRAFDAAAIFSENTTKFQGIRMLHDYALAQQGYADDEETALQAHFTDSPPALADLDGDGHRELITAASVQNASQEDRERGVALWVLNPDGTRPTAWLNPVHAPTYRGGLWDVDGENIVAITNQVTVADLDPTRAGPELAFVGYDGRVHVVGADATPIWEQPYTNSDHIWTGGILAADLSADGVPELVLATYSPTAGESELIVFDAGGDVLHRVPLPGRGAMAVPSIGDVDGDGSLDIVVNLKDDGEDGLQVAVFRVEGAKSNCLLWPTGRANLRRNGTL